MADAKAKENAGDSLSEETGEKRRRGRPAKAASSAKTQDQGTIDAFVRNGKGKEDSEAFAKSAKLVHSPQSAKTNAGKGDNGGAVSHNSNVSGEQQTGSTFDMAERKNKDNETERENNETENKATTKGTGADMDTQTGSKEERILEREMGERIVKSVLSALEKWRTEAESKIQAETGKEIEHLKERFRLAEEGQEKQQQELHNMKRRVEDLQNLLVEERNRRIEDKKITEQGHTEGQPGDSQQQSPDTSEDEQEGEQQRDQQAEAEEEEECKRRIPEKLSKGELEFELRERLERKNNIFVRGVKTVGKGVGGEVRDLIEERLSMPVKIADCRPIGGGLVLTLNTFKNKIEIMKRKSEFRGTGIWIEDDLTEREKEINEWFERLAKIERRKGNVARTGYLKIRVNDEWKIWSENTGTLETRFFRSD